MRGWAIIICDDQAGSKDLFPYVRSLTLDAVLTRVDPPFGDFVWVGNGPDGSILKVAVEYKKIDEILDAIGGNGRFVGHQVGGLCLNYDRRYLLVEGRIRADRKTGILQKLQRDKWCDIHKAGRGFTYRDLEGWYTTIEEQAQFRVKTTFDEHESARWIVAKHSWYVNKEWEEHSALKQFHVPAPPTALFVKPSLVRRVAKELGGVGWDKSIAVEGKFTNVRGMINASESTWREIDGIGKVMARRIVAEIEGVNK